MRETGVAAERRGRRAGERKAKDFGEVGKREEKGAAEGRRGNEEARNAN